MTTAEMQDRAHALLSASSAKIWLTCTPSAREAEKYEDKGSSYADEGTAAHAYADMLIRFNLGEGDSSAGLDLMGELKTFRETNPYYNAEMEEAVGCYVRFVFERFALAQKLTKDAILLTEQRLDYSAYAPEGFGTGDVVIIADEIMEVIDLKYGKGVPVSAIENPQLRLYGVGALVLFGLLYDIKKVIMTICQPRLDSIGSDLMAAEDLLSWANGFVKPRALQAWEGKGPFVPGEQCRFCNALVHCKALATYNLAMAKYDFVEGNELTLDDIADILQRGEMLQTWLTKIQAYALEQAYKNGVKIPGWKLVEGRSTRKYSDPAKIAEILVAAGYEEPLLYERSLYGITAMEKIVGKKKFGELLNDYIEKPPGAPTLAPEDDKRAEIGSTQSARNDFADDILN